MTEMNLFLEMTVTLQPSPIHLCVCGPAALNALLFSMHQH